MAEKKAAEKKAADNKKEMSDEELANQSLEQVQKSIKTNRILFISLVVVMALVLSILITTTVVINVQMSNRREVPAEEFAEQLATLDSQLEHLVALHNSEAKVYFNFQDSLQIIRESYTHEKVNEVRRQLAERERDQQKLLQLMQENASSLAAMIPGSRDWTSAYSKKIEDAVKLSQKREKALKEAMAALDDASKPAAKQEQKNNAPASQTKK